MHALYNGADIRQRLSVLKEYSGPIPGPKCCRTIRKWNSLQLLLFKIYFRSYLRIVFVPVTLLKVW